MATLYTPQDFGALANGTADDTAKVQDAFDSGEPAIWFDKQNYRIDGPVTITNPVHVFGNGFDRTSLGDAATNIVTQSEYEDTFVINSHNVIMERLNISGNGSRFAANRGRAIAVGTDHITLTDGVISSGNLFRFSSATATFTAANEKNYITVYGAGAAGINHATRILTYVDANTVDLEVAAVTAVSGATVVYGEVYEGATFRDVSAASHSRAAHFENASNYMIDHCFLQSYHCIENECRTSADKGDSMIMGSHLRADKTAGRIVTCRSGGGLKMFNDKFLAGQFGIYYDWDLGKSGGPIITGCEMESITGYFGYFDGTAPLSGLVWTGNRLNGNGRIYIGDNLELNDLIVVGNIMRGGSPAQRMRIGKKVTGFSVDANLINGPSAGNGIHITPTAADGLIGDGTMFIDCGTDVVNYATDNVTVL